MINYGTNSDSAVTSAFVCGQNESFVQIGGRFWPLKPTEDTPGIKKAFAYFGMAIWDDFIPPKLLAWPAEENFPLGNTIQRCLPDKLKTDATLRQTHAP